MTEKTVTDALRDVGYRWGTTLFGYDAAEDICAALGIDPDAPVANLHVLTEGQHVVEVRDIRYGVEKTVIARSGDTHQIVTKSHGGHWPVVVRSHKDADDTSLDGCDCPVSSGEGAWAEAHDPECSSLNPPVQPDRSAQRWCKACGEMHDATDLAFLPPAPSLASHVEVLAPRVRRADGGL